MFEARKEEEQIGGSHPQKLRLGSLLLVSQKIHTYILLSWVIDQKGVRVRIFFPMDDYRAPISALFSGRCHKSKRKS